MLRRFASWVRLPVTCSYTRSRTLRMALETPPSPTRGAVTFFERRELDRLLRLYGRMVAAGEWRDYAIDGLKDAAIFSIFRRASEAPLYRIEKRPDLARRQGAWAVIGEGGMTLRRGHELDQVLRFFERGRFAVVE
jgi:hypothetical protein